MKPTRIFATASLIVSSIALITAANISVGDEGVVRMSSFTPQEGTAPVPSPDTVGSAGVAAVQQPPVMQAPPGMYPQPGNYAPYFERSMGATGVVPGVGYQPVQPFGPIMMFESNLDNGLGYGKGYQRFNARVPYHIIPNTTVLLGDLSASVTYDGAPIFNGGVVYRNYDELRNRVFGWNSFFDYDEGYGNGDWTRVSAGFESLGKYIDFRGNAYFVAGADSALISSTLSPNLALSGNGIYKMRTNVQENAYSGFDLEAGGPLPLLGRYGMNMYPGMYYLTNDDGGDTTGFQVRWEALITQNVTVNTYLTTDEKFDTNAWVSLQYEIPNYRRLRTLKPRVTRERLMDPVVRQNRIQTHIDSVVSPEALINTATGVAYNVINVDPNATAPGTGTFENPFNTLQAADTANTNLVDIIRVRPRLDDTGTNLTVNGGMSLFDDQTLLSSLKPLTLAPDCIIPAETFTGTAPLGPLVSDPVMVAGGSVINIANNNSVIGFRIDASNAANTVFGNGVSNALPITDVNISCNIFSDYVIGANLQDVSGRVIVDENEFNGLLGVSDNGLDLSIAGGSTADVLVRNNIATDNSGVGLNILAQAGSTLNADDPDGTVPTGIVDNNASGNGTGIAIAADTGATINAVVEDNTAEDNTFDGLAMTSDGGTFTLASLSGNQLNNNIGNGTFIHYLNGGIFNSVSEDADGDGTLDAGEDLNGNGTLDLGIVSNTMSGNEIAGLCIFGENASVGAFDVGGPRAALGNTFVGNAEGGVLMDLRDTATGQIDALFNTVTGGNATPGLTIVLDFVDAAQGSVTDGNGFQVDPFDITAYGFNASQYDTVTNAILATVEDYYRNLPTSADNPLSTLPPGQELNVDFVIGDAGTAPSNGATEYYVVTIGDSPTAPAGLAGLSSDIGQIRNKNGQGPGQGLTPVPLANGGSAVGVYTNNVVALSTFLTPPNALGVNEGIHVASPEKSAPYALNALTSGNLTFTRRALGFIASHELGHAVSLRHIEDSTATTPNGLHPIMGTPAIDLPIQALVEDAEFALSGTNPGEIPGEAAFTQNDISQLVSALGTRVTAGESKAGIRVTATDSARLLDSTMNNNTITGMSQDGIAVVMNDSAVAEGVTIQSNSITNGAGNGIRLEANGANAEIHADNTIGGSGINVYSGTSYNQGNFINNNDGDGFRALASNGGLINGNLINNTITNNTGNGAALLIDNGGDIDFGTVASNRVIRGNTITGNGEAGLLLNQLTSPGTEAEIDATVVGNTLSNNLHGGIVANLLGANHIPPALPVIQDNNRLNLVIGGAAAADANTISGNTDVGIAVNVTGNGNADVTLTDVTVTGTQNGTNPTLNGDGINFRRQDSSLLTATLNGVTSTGNEGDGLDVDVQGNDKTDPNQPNTGTANTVTIDDSNFSNNDLNGAVFRTRGDSTLISDITLSTFADNTLNGIAVQTSENSSFGDPTVGLPPGRRSVFDGLFVDGNGNDGVQIIATEQSRALVQITSTTAAATGGAHSAASTLGNTNISNNGRDGVHIETSGGSSDILITANSATTTIDGNGTVAGGNGIRWDSSGTADATVRVTRTTITNSEAGASEDTNGNGVLDAGEDLNANGDIDVADGDGIQANFTEDTTSTLIVGNAGEGNVIQNNEDDGVAVTATGSNSTGNPRPVITLTDNTIGGTRNGLDAGNAGDGVSLNVFGGTAAGIPTASIDFTAPGLSPNGGVTESGAVPQFTMTNNLVSNNDARGVNLLLTGASGTRNRENGASIFDPVRITLTDNTIVSNGNEGVFYRADANMNQDRFVYIANFPDPPNIGNNNISYSPFQAPFFALNAGSVNGNTAYLAPFFNLRTVQNSLFTMTGNTVQNNGVNTVTGEGLRIDVGTGSYVAADIQNNVFGGNLEEDVVTSSFLSLGNTRDSLDNNGNNTFDVVYLDDTAQLDMRFQNNSGNQIAPSDVGAVYTNADPWKVVSLGAGVLNRDASFFQVDNGPGLNDPNNTFINFGTTQNIQNAFTTGNYNIRGAADPAWPNIGFAPFLP